MESLRPRSAPPLPPRSGVPSELGSAAAVHLAPVSQRKRPCLNAAATGWRSRREGQWEETPGVGSRGEHEEVEREAEEVNEEGEEVEEEEEAKVWSWSTGGGCGGEVGELGGGGGGAGAGEERE